MNLVETMLQAIRADLEANQIDLNGIHNDVLDMIYQYYTELVSTESQEARQAHLACMDAILRIIQERDRISQERDKVIQERDEARGMVQLQEPDCGHPQEGQSQAIHPQPDQTQEQEDYNYDNLPYNQEVEDLLGLFSEDAAALERSTFKVGFAAGARLVFELMGEGPVGVRKSE